MTAALEGDEWSAARPGRTLPPGKTRYQFYMKLGGTQGREENLVRTGIRSWIVQPIAQSLYRLSYPAHWMFKYIRKLHVLGSSATIVYSKKKVKVKWFRYRPGVAQRVSRGIALLFHDRGTRRGWVISNKPRPHCTPGKGPVPILQKGGWAPGPVWTGGKSLPNRDSIPDRPDRSSIAVPTELPGPQLFTIFYNK